MSLRKASITWNANQIAKMVNNGKVTFDNVVQRSYVWEPTRRSKLITSMIIGFPIPPWYSGIWGRRMPWPSRYPGR